jgi:hypothetical protein
MRMGKREKIHLAPGAIYLFQLPIVAVAHVRMLTMAASRA